MSDVRSLVAPAAAGLPGNAGYLRHLDRAAADPGLLRLASNESVEPPPPAVRAAIARAADRAHLYPPTSHPLRARLAGLHGVDPAGVLVGAGATEPIEAALRCFLAPGDDVVAPAPTWPVYGRRLAAAGARVHAVPLRRAPDAFAADVDAMLAAVTPQTKLIVAPSPNNPTGETLPPGALTRLANAGPVVLADQAYVDFAEPGAGDEALALARTRANVLVARTFSKAYALAGMRVGYLVCDPATADLVERLALPGWSVSVAALEAALAALDEREWYAANVAAVRAERERLTAALRAAGLAALRSDANFVAVDCEGLAGGAAALRDAFLAEGVLIRDVTPAVARISVPRGAAAERLLAAVPRAAAAALAA